MKNLIVLAMFGLIGYMAWGRLNPPTAKPLYDHPYVVVYGRETCGFTQETMDRLKRANVKFEFASVDDRASADELHTRMKLMGLDTSDYLLPVVDLNNSLSIRPDDDELVAHAKSLKL